MGAYFRFVFGLCEFRELSIVSGGSCFDSNAKKRQERMHRSYSSPWELVWMLAVFEQACVLVILQAASEFEDVTRFGEAARLGPRFGRAGGQSGAKLLVSIGNMNVPRKQWQKCWSHEQLRQQLHIPRSNATTNK